MKKKYTPDDIRSKLRHYTPLKKTIPNFLKPASVLIPFFMIDDELSLVFMKRPDRPEPHGGQISFPGGSKEPEDKNDQMTAVRETEEEYGVQRETIEVWGQLQSRKTRASNFWIVPFVGRLPDHAVLKPNPDEVERLIIVPFDHFFQADVFAIDDYVWRGRAYRTHLFKVGDDVIWGLTARILSSFLSLLESGHEN